MAKESTEEEKPVENVPEAAQPSTADYDNFAQPEKPIRNWTRILTIFIIFLLILGAGAAAAWYLSKPKPAKQPTESTTQTAAAPKTVATKSYTSPNLYLTFAYPSNWTIVDSGGGVMTVTSPTMEMKNIANQTTSGQVTMTIKTSAQTLPGFGTGSATAVMDSQKITYTHPTQTQRANTYISFLTYPSTTGTNALDAIYVTGDNGYTKDQTVPQADLVQVSPIISVTFKDKEGKALTISAKNWDNTDFSGPILAMLESLSIT